jgi:hypothetical protein
VVKPPNLVAAYVDLYAGTIYADGGLPDLSLAGQVISSGTLVDGALAHFSLVDLDSDDHSHYVLVDGSRAFSGNIGVAAIVPTTDAHLTRKDYVDSAVASGVAGVTSVNTLDGAVLLAGAGEVSLGVVGQTITFSGTSLDNALVGADGVVVASGTNTDTISGFYSEFSNASGTLSSEIDADIAVHAAASAAHHVRYTDGEAILALGPTTGALAASGVALGAELVSVSGTLSDALNNYIVAAYTEFLTFSGSTHARIDAAEVELTKNIGINNPTASEDVSWFYTPVDITITEMTTVLRGSATPTVTIGGIMHNTNRNAAGNNVIGSGVEITSTTTGQQPPLSGDVTVPLGSFVWLETTAQGGTVDELFVSITYTED